jgi:GGDEF domain-containing protein
MVWARHASGNCGWLRFALPKRTMQEAFGEYLRQGIELARQEQRGFSVIAFIVESLDKLKTSHGGEALADLLSSIEQRLNEMIRQRSGDQVIRGPNGEMAVILAQVGKVGSKIIAERTRGLLEGQPWRIKDLPVALKFQTAIATYPDEAATAEALLRLVEQRMNGGQP